MRKGKQAARKEKSKTKPLSWVDLYEENLYLDWLKCGTEKQLRNKLTRNDFNTLMRLGKQASKKGKKQNKTTVLKS